MYDDWPHAAIYLSATVSGYWQWSDNGQEISWADGLTMTFVPELMEVLRRLALDGLPPLGSVLLLMAACRNNWPRPPSRRGLLAGVLNTENSVDSHSLLWEVCNGLDKVHSLPSDLRHTTAGKAEIAALVFADAPSRLNGEVSQKVVETLERDGIAYQVRPTQAITSGYWLLRDLGALREGLSRLDEQALRLRIETGLETLPIPATVAPPPLRGTAWLAWLEQQQEFSGLARMARRLLAIVHIPRHLHETDELPLGGVTDIAPRGVLDRLLFSELAYDDLTLAVRIAMHEALYLRRESPPKTPPRRRHVVLDCGLRSWGLPRLYGTAVALAMAVHNDKHVEVFAHRASGTTLTPVILDTAEGLREHLSTLDHQLHPGEALPALVALLAADEDGDAVIVTAEATLADPDFQQALAHYMTGTVYLASVARDGRLELQQHSRSGRKTLCTAELPLDEILADRSASARLRDASRAALPAIFSASPFPLLLSVQPRPENSWYLDGWGVLTLTGDGRLLEWRSKDRGARQLAIGLPEGRIHAVLHPGGESFAACLVVGKLSRRGLHAIWIDRDGTIGRRMALSSTVDRVDSVAVDRTYAYLHSGQVVEAVDLHSGQPAKHRWLAAQQKLHGLYVQGSSKQAIGPTSNWSRLSGAGSDINFVPVITSSTPSSILSAFDVVGVEGPVVICESGEIVRTATGERKRMQASTWTRTLVVHKVSRDGRRFYASADGKPLIGDTLTGAIRPAMNPAKELESELYSLARPRVLRNRFVAIGFTADGYLILTATKGTLLRLQTDSLVFVHLPREAQPLARCEFQPMQHQDAGRIALRQAQFPDGSVAVLDARGLLHLQSSDAALPHCTMVLQHGLSAGWCSDGRTWGSSYFIGDRTASDPRVISRDILQPFAERVQCSGH